MEMNMPASDEDAAGPTTALLANGPPIHVLMSEERQPPEYLIEERLKRDYLSRRYRATQRLHCKKEPAASKTDMPFWSGASMAEKALIGCCENIEEYTNAIFRGALDKTKIVQFITVIHRYCHNLVNRSLVLTVLERSLELDAHERDTTAEQTECTTEPDAMMKRKRINQDIVAEVRGGERMHHFVALGGVKILNQWLIDASTPAGVSRLDKGSSARRNPPVARTEASATSSLMLPLLRVLTNIPIDKETIRESKINKSVKKLSKVINRIIEENKNTNHFNEVTGSVPATTVQKAVDNLMSTWQEKSIAGTLPLPEDPIASVKRIIATKAQEIAEIENGDDKPEWLRNFEKKASEQQPKKSKKLETTKELVQREHEREKSRLRQDDLRKVAEERTRLLRKLRSMHQHEELTVRIHIGTNRKRVKWKDGLSSASNSKKQELLEDVHVFTKDEWSGTRFTDAANEEMDLENDLFGG